MNKRNTKIYKRFKDASVDQQRVMINVLKRELDDLNELYTKMVWVVS